MYWFVEINNPVVPLSVLINHTKELFKINIQLLISYNYLIKNSTECSFNVDVNIGECKKLPDILYEIIIIF